MAGSRMARVRRLSHSHLDYIAVTGPQARVPGGPLKAIASSDELPVMLLADYYEHGIEHAPPRESVRRMQKRESDYTTPPDRLLS